MQRPSVSAVSPSIAQQHSALKRQSPSTALSRLAKLAKLSPVIRQPQPYSPSPLAPPVQQQVAAAQPDWHTAQGIDKSKGTSVQLSHNQPHSPPAAPASASNHSSPPLKHNDADTSAPGISEANKTEDVRDGEGMQRTCLSYIVQLPFHAVRQYWADSCSASVCTAMWGLTSLLCKAFVHAFISSHRICLPKKATRSRSSRFHHTFQPELLSALICHCADNKLAVQCRCPSGLSSRRPSHGSSVY